MESLSMHRKAPTGGLGVTKGAKAPIAHGELSRISLKKQIEVSFTEAGLSLDTGKNWTPADRAIRAWRESREEETEECT